MIKYFKPVRILGGLYFIYIAKLFCRSRNMENNDKIINPSLYSPANLAYLGDCVFELYVREYLVKNNTQRPSVESLKYVTAHVQSQVIEKILPMLTEEEEHEYKRGRNLGHTNVPKSSTPSEYRRATGLEALFGWLYLSGKHDRLRELFDAVFGEKTETDVE